MTSVAFHLAAMGRAATDHEMVHNLKVAIAKSNRDLMRRFK